MNKLFFLLLLLAATGSQAQNIYSSLHLNDNREYEYGKPLRITETKTFHHSSGTTVEKTVKTFDSNGHLTMEQRLNEEGRLSARLTYQIDSLRGLILERTMERWMTYGYAKEKAVYTYDANGFLKTISDYNEKGNLINRSEQENNEKGHPISLKVFAANGQLFGTETAQYNYAENKAITKVYGNDGSLTSTDTLKIQFKRSPGAIEGTSIYNDHGHIASSVTTNLSGVSTLQETEYKYDNTGNIIDQKIYKVTIQSNGKKKRKLDRHFTKKIEYRK